MAKDSKTFRCASARWVVGSEVIFRRWKLSFGGWKLSFGG
jgi:hypothetical protein